MTQERNEKIRCNPTQATQGSEKKSGGSERKQPTFWLNMFTLRSSRFLFALLGCLGWVAAHFFRCVPGSYHVVREHKFRRVPQKYHRFGERIWSRVPPVTKYFLVFGIEYHVFLGNIILII